MELDEIMSKKIFAVVGDTLDPDKYAYKIKAGLQKHGYTVYAVGKELSSVNDIQKNIEIIDLCINPSKGLKLIQECRKNFECIVIQPGAESVELIEYLENNHFPYVNGCLLLGLSLYGNKNK
ncbi:hypothetical protein SDC9_68848 [bioreactor metagenome]|uniref:CoA-binding domain-containing protein n=1 Tax=bioreactor metagenome TaxID=1076179 RepID=A0A644Y1L9_9ZZZZ|nr:CoA-binding protein [Candidatus Metalachnospira sp.]